MSLALTTIDNLNCVTFEPAHPCRWGHERRRQVEERGQLINLRKEAHAVGNQLSHPKISNFGLCIENTN